MIKAFENSEEKKRQCIDAFQRDQDEFFFDEHYTECIPRYIGEFINYNIFRNKHNDQINCVKFLKSIPIGTSNWTDILQQWFACMCDKAFKDHIIRDDEIKKIRDEIIVLDKNNCSDYEKWNEKLKMAGTLMNKFEKLEKSEGEEGKNRLEKNPAVKRQDELKTYHPMDEKEKQIRNIIKDKLKIISKEHLNPEDYSNMWNGNTDNKLNFKINDIAKIMIGYMRNIEVDSIVKEENYIKWHMANLFFVYSNLRLQEINKFEISDVQKCSMGELCEALETLVLDIDQLKSQMIPKPDEDPFDSDDPQDELRQYMEQTFLKLFKSTD